MEYDTSKKISKFVKKNANDAFGRDKKFETLLDKTHLIWFFFHTGTKFHTLLNCIKIHRNFKTTKPHPYNNKRNVLLRPSFIPKFCEDFT